MSPEQVKMLGVKATIERAIQSYTTVYSTYAAGMHSAFVDEVDRFVAGLYASRQIDKSYTVAMSSSGFLEVVFSVGSHASIVNYMVPSKLWPTKQPAPTTAPIAKAGDILEKMRKVFDEKKTAPAPTPNPTPLAHHTIVIPGTQSNQSVFEEAVAKLEDIFDEYVSLDNVPHNRERVKRRIWDEAKKLLPESSVWVTCDDTNNPDYKRSAGEFIIEVEAIFKDDDNAYIAEMVLKRIGPVKKTDPVVLSAVGTAFAALERLRLPDMPAAMINIRLKNILMEKSNVCDVEVTTKLDCVSRIATVTLNIQPYPYSEWISYPITRQF